MDELATAERCLVDPGRPPYKTLAQWAAIRLREMVAHSQLPAGQRLDEVELRAAIAGMAARKSDNGSRTSALVDVLGGMDAALASEQLTDCLELDIAVHDSVVHASGNTRLVEARVRARDQPRCYLAPPLTCLSIDSLRGNAAEHRAIYDAIRKADAELAEKLTRVYIMSNGERIAEAMRSPVAE